MLSIEECRQLLGADARDLTDEQVRELRGQMYRLASIAVDMAENNWDGRPKGHQALALRGHEGGPAEKRG